MARRQSERSLEWLRDILETDAPADPAGNAADGKATMPAPKTSVFDCGQVEMYTGGSPDKGRRILSAIAEHGPSILEDVNRAHSRARTDRVLETVHDLRGLAQVVGAYAAAQVCLQVELLYESASIDRRHQLMVDLDGAVTPLFDAIRGYLDTWAA
jgi:HPt (histidine-containing phosphotransfer) domain-containing protein